MEDHKCPFAEAIGQSPAWQTDDDGLTVCKYCHAPKFAERSSADPVELRSTRNPVADKVPAKTLRK